VNGGAKEVAVAFLGRHEVADEDEEKEKTIKVGEDEETKDEKKKSEEEAKAKEQKEKEQKEKEAAAAAPQFSEEKKDAMRRGLKQFLDACREGLDANARLCITDQDREFQAVLSQQFDETCHFIMVCGELRVGLVPVRGGTEGGMTEGRR
jgi:outer membrane biosynthesis protein TonB